MSAAYSGGWTGASSHRYNRCHGMGTLLVAILGAYILNSLSSPGISLPAILLVYVLIQGVAYTFVLKHMVLLNIGTIATEFVLRAIAGAAVLDITVTPWLLMCWFAGAFSRR